MRLVEVAPGKWVNPDHVRGVFLNENQGPRRTDDHSLISIGNPVAVKSSKPPHVIVALLTEES